jgi:hypothetical protein
MNKNTEYEKFIQDIYLTLLKQDGLTIDVKHNLKLAGKATKHQIDVLWEYQINQKKSRNLIECKNINRKISLGRVRDFYSVILDIGDSTGKMVSKLGFTRGAIQFAKYYGIDLLLIREPEVKDCEGKVKETRTIMKACENHVISKKIILDADWLNINHPSKPDFKFTITEKTDETWFFNSKGEKVINLFQIIEKLPYDESERETKFDYLFYDNYIINPDLGKIKVKRIEFYYKSFSKKYQLNSDGGLTAKAIINDIINKENYFVHKIGNI